MNGQWTRRAQIFQNPHKDKTKKIYLQVVPEALLRRPRAHVPERLVLQPVPHVGVRLAQQALDGAVRLFLFLCFFGAIVLRWWVHAQIQG